MIEADITITDNADWALPLYFADGNDVPYDLSGRSLILQARVRPGSPAVVDLTRTNGGIEAVDLANGHLIVHFARNAAAAGDYVYDFLSIAGGMREYLLGGRLTVIRGVTL